MPLENMILKIDDITYICSATNLKIPKNPTYFVFFQNTDEKTNKSAIRIYLLHKKNAEDFILKNSFDNALIYRISFLDDILPKAEGIVRLKFTEFIYELSNLIIYKYFSNETFPIESTEARLLKSVFMKNSDCFDGISKTDRDYLSRLLTS